MKRISQYITYIIWLLNLTIIAFTVPDILYMFIENIEIANDFTYILFIIKAIFKFLYTWKQCIVWVYHSFEITIIVPEFLTKFLDFISPFAREFLNFSHSVASKFLDFNSPFARKFLDFNDWVYTKLDFYSSVDDKLFNYLFSQKHINSLWRIYFYINIFNLIILCYLIIFYFYNRK